MWSDAANQRIFQLTWSASCVVVDNHLSTVNIEVALSNNEVVDDGNGARLRTAVSTLGKFKIDMSLAKHYQR